MLLLAAYEVLLYRYGGHEDVIVGCPIAGRTDVNMERLMGCFTNTLLLRAAVHGDLCFRDFLAAVRDKALSAFEHQGAPLAKIVEAVNPVRTPGTRRMFQALFNVLNLPAPAAAPAELQIERWSFEHGLTQFDLSLTVAEGPGGIKCEWTYDSDLFAEDDVRRLVDAYKALCAAPLADPATRLGELPLMSVEERQRILSDRTTVRRLPARRIDRPIVRVASRAEPGGGGSGRWPTAMDLPRVESPRRTGWPTICKREALGRIASSWSDCHDRPN